LMLISDKSLATVLYITALVQSIPAVFSTLAVSSVKTSEQGKDTFRHGVF
jgi:hypothetical protein